MERRHHNLPNTTQPQDSLANERSSLSNQGLLRNIYQAVVGPPSNDTPTTRTHARNQPQEEEKKTSSFESYLKTKKLGFDGSSVPDSSPNNEIKRKDSSQKGPQKQPGLRKIPQPNPNLGQVGEEKEQLMYFKPRPQRGSYHRGRGGQLKSSGFKQTNQERASKIFEKGAQSSKPFGSSGFFSVSVLQSLNDQSSDELLEKMCRYRSLSDTINGTKFSYRGYSLLIELLSKLTKRDESEIKNNIIVAFFDSNFFKTLEQDYLKEIMDKTKGFEFASRVEDLVKIIEIMDAFSDLFRSRVNELPILAFKAFIVDGDLQLMQSMLDISGANSAKIQVLNLKANHLFNKRKELMANKMQDKAVKVEEAKERRPLAVDQSYKLDPPSDFQDINVIPDIRELISDQTPFLRCIPSTGGFKSPHDYLDCIFRLLHEDAIRPLREGLQCMVMSQRQPNFEKELYQLMKNSGVRLYESITMSQITLSIESKSPSIQFSLPTIKMKRVNWMHAKRLLPGSLVLLSPDKFKTILWGLVKFRDGYKMNQTSQKFNYAEINIEIIKSNVDNLESLVDLYEQFKYHSLTMIESVAYFEAYFHILNKLKAMDLWDEIPLMDKIAFIQKQDLNRPDYMEKAQLQVGLVSDMREGIRQAQLDPSQQQALERCLSNKLAIVQGPPGTGKTYVGQHFVKILLKLKDSWKSKGPLLLVCYTNHALDQFLNLIKGYTQNFVRIGGRCSDESLKQHQLKEYCLKNQIKRSVKFYRLLDILKKICQKFKETKMNMMLKQIGVIHGLLSDGDVTNLLFELKKQFNRYLREVCQKVFSPAELQGQNFIIKDFKDMIQEEQNQVIVFWLGIVDLQKYLTACKESVSSLEEYKENATDDLDILVDDQDQRNQDYHRNEDQVSALTVVKSNEIEQTFGQLTRWFSPANTSSFFGNASTFMECVEIGRRCLDEPGQFSMEDLFQLPLQTRWRINNKLVGYSQYDQLRDKQTLNLLVERFKKAAEEKQQVENMTNSRVFKHVDIVAMTTTGCAKQADLLKDISFPIVIVEEAAEVFEAHILTSLSKGTEQLVLIGDHQQLKPNPAVFELEKKYNLNMSMFERLVKNEFSYTTLQTQRRMRPEISSIIRLLYPNLKDDVSVTKSPAIRGIEKDVFFFDHQQFESTHDAMMSKLNDFEAVMIQKFSKYLLQQGYESKQITVLSLYQAQTIRIKKYMQEGGRYSPLNQIKVITVDNFQGEENDIIILSLVRSNAMNDIGYLKISNRVCVALSRAKHGMFIFGNSHCLLNFRRGVHQQNKLWQDVIAYLKDKDFIGSELTLKCRNHSNVTKIKEVNDFQNVPEGGCKKQCNVRLDCGHTCESFCHPYIVKENDETGHNDYKCFKPCVRQKPCGHTCTYLCYKCKEGCLPCPTIVLKEMQPCRHIIKVKCSEKLIVEDCTARCDKIHRCGHQCRLDCHENCQSGDYQCKERVNKVLPCGHTQEVDCYLSPMQHILDNGCHTPCGAELECGHKCPNQCGACYNNIFHGVCKQKCGRTLFCGHICQENCTKQCPPCEKPCETQCSHSKCKKKCKEVCKTCTEPCKSKCKHSACTKQCDQPCDRKPCYEQCDVKLKCGHSCIGLCGDKCIDICRACHSRHETFEILFGSEDDPNASFVQIDCGHVFEVAAMDKWMLSQSDNERRAIKFKECPKCKQQIKKCSRYQSVINAVFNDINQVKERVAIQGKALLEKYQEIFDSFEQTKKESFESYSVGTSYTAKLEKVFKEFQVNFEKCKNNADEMVRHFQKLELIRCYVEFLSFSHKYETKKLEAFASEMLHIKVLRAIKHLEYFKFIINQEQATSAKELSKYLNENFGSKKFKEMIMKAVDLGKGHWFKCKNGHYYTIGECGGAMQTSKCPDCGEVIGGSNHDLAAGNQHAGDFDGARRPAYDPHGFDQQVARGQVQLNRFA